MNLLFALYFFQALKPTTNAALIGKIARREIAAAFLTVGFADSPIAMGNKLIEDWKTTPMTLEAAAELKEPRQLQSETEIRQLRTELAQMRANLANLGVR